MAALRAEMAAAREAAAADRATLKASMEGDFATAKAMYEKQVQEQREAEKEKRVAHLVQQSLRRLTRLELAGGFSAWQEQWEEAARQKRMLVLAAGARLARPALAAAVDRLGGRLACGGASVACGSCARVVAREGWRADGGAGELDSW